MCRLGYLKILSCIVNNFQPYNEQRLARLLENAVMKNKKAVEWKFESEWALSETALIPKAGLASHYVELSYILDFFNSKNKRLGKFGKVINRVLLSRETPPDYKNEDDNPLYLDDAERAYFFHILIQKDGAALIPFMRDLEKSSKIPRDKNSKFSRGDAMNYFMEIIYSDALKSYLTETNKDSRVKLDWKTRKSFQAAIKDSQTWADRRKELQKSDKPEQWTNDPLYAKYRHEGNPRIEWLVDVGFLKKTDKFELSNHAKLINKELEKAEMEEDSDLLFLFGKIFVNDAEETSDPNNIKDWIVEFYKRFYRIGYFSVEVNLLACAISLYGLKNRQLIKFNLVLDVIRKLKESNSTAVKTILDRQGRPNYLTIDLKQTLTLQS